jgi:hypothetical protein
LRRKIERDPADPLWLQTVRGIGYRLSVDKDLTVHGRRFLRRRIRPRATRLWR